MREEGSLRFTSFRFTRDRFYDALRHERGIKVQLEVVAPSTTKSPNFLDHIHVRDEVQGILAW